jgi:hypothetical protein
MLKQFSMKESKRGTLPISYMIRLSKDMCPKTQIERDMIEMIPYTLVIGFIIYVMICTSPNVVSYALSITSRYQSNPSEIHWKIIKNIIKYLRRIKNVFFGIGC